MKIPLLLDTITPLCLAWSFTQYLRVKMGHYNQSCTPILYTIFNTQDSRLTNTTKASSNENPVIVGHLYSIPKTQNGPLQLMQYHMKIQYNFIVGGFDKTLPFLILHSIPKTQNWPIPLKIYYTTTTLTTSCTPNIHAIYNT